MVHVNDYSPGRIYVEPTIKCILLKTENKMKKKSQKHLYVFKKVSFYLGSLGGSVKCPTLGLGSGHDLIVCEFEPYIRLRADSAEPACDSLSLSLSPFLSASPPLTLSVSLKNKEINLKKKKNFLLISNPGLGEIKKCFL